MIEAIAVAFLCSGKKFDVMTRFIEDKYSSHKAVDQLLRNAKKLSLKSDGVQALKQSQEFYHKCSHMTKMTRVES